MQLEKRKSYAYTIPEEMDDFFSCRVTAPGSTEISHINLNAQINDILKFKLRDYYL